MIAAANKFDDEQVEGVITTSSSSQSPFNPDDAKYTQLKKLFIVKDAKTPEEMSEAILGMKTKFDRIIGLHSSWGKSIIPRIAASFEGACITDTLAIEQAGSIIKRPIYAGRTDWLSY